MRYIKYIFYLLRIVCVDKYLNPNYSIGYLFAEIQIKISTILWPTWKVFGIME